MKDTFFNLSMAWIEMRNTDENLFLFTSCTDLLLGVFISFAQIVTVDAWWRPRLASD